MDISYSTHLDFAWNMDDKDPLGHFREQFFIPEVNGEPAIYLCGNSLGLQPKSIKRYLEQELEDWANLGVEGHVHARNPWMYYHRLFTAPLARVAGCKEHEVVAMNGLTVNLHILLASFYRPQGKRYKILVESQLFPSDYFVAISQVEQYIRLSGRTDINPEEAVLPISPREGEHTVRDRDVLDLIEQEGESLALVLLGGVNYYTGQLFDMKSITAAAHEAGALAGFDLAHAIGNVPLKLHDWEVDFASWCSYKYLNSGPGGPSGIYVHERHALNPDTPQLKGWWGHEEETRFNMEKKFVPIAGAGRWQISNVPILGMAAHKASLDIFDQTTLQALREKSERLTGYLEFLIRAWLGDKLRIITPAEPQRRGCQLSLLTGKEGPDVFREITRKGVIADWRSPNVIRVAPTPLYNTFTEVYRFAKLLKDIYS